MVASLHQVMLTTSHRIRSYASKNRATTKLPVHTDSHRNKTIRQPKRNDSIHQGPGKNRGASHSTPTTPRHQNPRNSVLTYQIGRQPLKNRWTGHQHPGKTNSTKRTKLSIHQVPTRKRNQIYSRNKMDMENCLCLGTPDTLQACCYRQRRIYSGSESREICTLHKEFSSGRHTPYTASNFCFHNTSSTPHTQNQSAIQNSKPLTTAINTLPSLEIFMQIAEKPQ